MKLIWLKCIIRLSLTSKECLMGLEFPAGHTERYVTKRWSIKQTSQIITKSTLRDFDWSTIRLTRHIHGVAYYRHLEIKRQECVISCGNLLHLKDWIPILIFLRVNENGPAPHQPGETTPQQTVFSFGFFFKLIYKVSTIEPDIKSKVSLPGSKVRWNSRVLPVTK